VECCKLKMRYEVSVVNIGVGGHDDEARNKNELSLPGKWRCETLERRSKTPTILLCFSAFLVASLK